MQYGSYSHSKWIVAFLMMLSISSVLWVGCGQKGPPRPPHRPLPPAVKDLSYAIYGEMVELSWTVPGAEVREASPPAAVKVFRSRLTAAEASCEKCPVRYSESGHIPIHGKRSDKSKPLKMSHTEFVAPGFRYFYKVIVFDQHGISGKESNVVKFDR